MQRHSLPNGLRLVVIPTASQDIVALKVFTPRGSRLETPQTQGIAHLMATVLTKGAGELTSQDIANKIEAVGASINCDTQADYGVLNLSCLQGDLPHLLRLVAQILQNPTFPASELELEQRTTLQAIRSQQERPFTLGYQQLRQQLYGPSHPYGFAELGTPETVPAITQEQLLAYYRATWIPQQMVVTVASSLEPEVIVDLVTQSLGDWTVPLPEPPAPETLEPGLTRTHIVQQTQQVTLLIGYPAAPLLDPDHLALKLLSTYLGSGLSSRLFVELREKQGLAYEVSAFYPGRLGPSHFVTYIGTAPHNLEVAEAGLRSEVQRLRTTLLTDEELRVTKNKLSGQYALSKQSSNQLARVLGLYEVLGFGFEYDQAYPRHIQNLTSQDLRRVASAHFEESYTCVVGTVS